MVTDPATATYQLDVEACRDDVERRANAVGVGPELVVTVAHALEGASSIELRGHDGQARTAELVYLDVDVDVALLRLDQPVDHWLVLDEPKAPESVDILTVETGSGPMVVEGRIEEIFDATIDGVGRREAARLTAAVEPGDSGAAVVDPAGHMVAMVFATDRDDEVAWAVSSAEIQAAIDQFEGTDTQLLATC